MEFLESAAATSGTARVLGTDPWRAPAEHRARVGVMLQDGGIPVTATARRLLRHVSRLHAAPVDLGVLMERVELDRVADRSVRRLSGGERQRVALAAALVGRPEVAFLDEPTAGLDPHARLEVWDLVRETAREAAVVVTTHSFEEAERIADHVVIMTAGRVVAQGSLAEVCGGRPLEERYFALTKEPSGTAPNKPAALRGCSPAAVRLDAIRDGDILDMASSPRSKIIPVMARSGGVTPPPTPDRRRAT